MMKKPFASTTVHRLTKLAVVLGLVFSTPAFSATYYYYYATPDSENNYKLTVNSNGEITEGSAVGTTVQEGAVLTGAMIGDYSTPFRHTSDNTVMISGGTMSSVSGGSEHTFNSVNVTNNTVIITGRNHNRFCHRWQ